MVWILLFAIRVCDLNERREKKRKQRANKLRMDILRLQTQHCYRQTCRNKHGPTPRERASFIQTKHAAFERTIRG